MAQIHPALVNTVRLVNVTLRAFTGFVRNAFLGLCFRGRPKSGNNSSQQIYLRWETEHLTTIRSTVHIPVSHAQVSCTCIAVCAVVRTAPGATEPIGIGVCHAVEDSDDGRFEHAETVGAGRQGVNDLAGQQGHHEHGNNETSSAIKNDAIAISIIAEKRTKAPPLLKKGKEYILRQATCEDRNLQPSRRLEPRQKNS